MIWGQARLYSNRLERSCSNACRSAQRFIRVTWQRLSRTSEHSWNLSSSLNRAFRWFPTSRRDSTSRHKLSRCLPDRSRGQCAGPKASSGFSISQTLSSSSWVQGACLPDSSVGSKWKHKRYLPRADRTSIYEEDDLDVRRSGRAIQSDGTGTLRTRTRVPSIRGTSRPSGPGAHQRITRRGHLSSASKSI